MGISEHFIPYQTGTKGDLNWRVNQSKTFPQYQIAHAVFEPKFRFCFRVHFLLNITEPQDLLVAVLISENYISKKIDCFLMCFAQ